MRACNKHDNETNNKVRQKNMDESAINALIGNAGYPVAIVLLTILLVLLSISYSRSNGRIPKPWIQVPGSIPILGHWHKIWNIRDVINVVEQWCDEYGVTGTGVMEVNFIGRSIVVVCREDRLMELLPYRVPDKMTRPPALQESASAVGVSGLYAAEGDQWQLENRLVRACLNQSSIQDYMQVLHTINHRLIEKWRQESLHSDSIAVLESLALAASDSLALTAMKIDFDSLHNPNSRLVKDLNIVVRGAIRRTLSPIRFWRIPFIGQYLDGCGWAIRRMKTICGDAVDSQQASLDQLVKSEEDEKYSKTFLQKLLGLTISGKTKLERHRLTGQVMTLVFAGTDTSSKTITHALYLLAKDQQLQSTLRHEVDTQMPSKQSLSSASLHELQTKLPHLKSFVHEFHRHHGSAASFWYTIADIPFCGTILPKGSVLMIMKRFISCNKVNPSTEVPIGPNGERPFEFCAERFLIHNEDGSLAPTPTPSNKSGSFGGFGHGIRSCPGRTYAEAVTYLTIASVLQNFEWELAANHPETRIILDLIQMPDKEIRLRLVPREERHG